MGVRSGGMGIEETLSTVTAAPQGRGSLTQSPEELLEYDSQ